METEKILGFLERTILSKDILFIVIICIAILGVIYGLLVGNQNVDSVNLKILQKENIQLKEQNELLKNSISTLEGVIKENEKTK